MLNSLRIGPKRRPEMNFKNTGKPWMDVTKQRSSYAPRFHANGKITLNMNRCCYLCRLGLNQQFHYKWGDETSYHIICECTAISSSRAKITRRQFLGIQELSTMERETANTMERSGR